MLSNKQMDIFNKMIQGNVYLLQFTNIKIQRLTSLAESLIDLFLFLVLTDTEGGEIRSLTPASSCIAIG